MASSKEVLKEWLKQGNYLDDNSVIDSLYNMKAPTDELAEQRFLDMYGNVAPFDKADRIEEPTIPSMSNVIGILGLDSLGNTVGKDVRTKEQKFIEEFPKKSARWKKKITNNNVYGERGWETVKEIWKQAIRDRMQADIAKARKKATDDGLYAKYASVMLPRSVEHIANTGDFSAKDILADLGENLAMAVPGSVFTGIAGKGLAKVAPKAVKYFSGPGSNIVEGAVKGAGRVAGNLFGNAVVPFGAEAMDAAIYDDSDEGMEHRADFSTGDAAIGTAINQGVNRGLMRMAGPIIDRFSSGGMARGGITRVRDFLENLGQPFSKKGDDFASSVMLESSVPIRNAGELLESDLERAARGSSVNSAATTEAARQNIAKRHVLEAIDNGEIVAIPKSGRGAGKAAEIQEGGDVFLENEIAKKAAENQRYGLEDILDYSGYLKAHPDGSGLSEKTLAATLSANLPEFYNIAIWHGAGAAKKGIADKTLNILNQAIPAWSVNKYGSDPDAGQVLAYFPETKKVLDEDREKTHEAPKKRKATADVLRIVSEGDSLTADDRKYLDAIAKNPDIMKIGYKDDPGGFRLWLLERGNRLLQGTSVYRPTFPVK